MKPEAILESNQLIADAIDGAEEIPDPLAGLAEKTAADPGAPFALGALEALAALKQDKRAAFEALRSQRVSAAGLPAAFSRRQAARRVRKPFNRR
jgi:hypothetical protein